MISDNEAAIRIINDPSVKKNSAILRKTFKYIDIDDFNSCKNVAIVKLIKFMKRVNPDKPIAKMPVVFYTFLKRELINIIVHDKKIKRLATGERLALGDNFPQKESLSYDFIDCVSGLSARESYVFSGFFLDRKSLKELSQELQCSKAIVGAVLKQARNNFIKKWREK